MHPKPDVTTVVLFWDTLNTTFSEEHHRVSLHFSVAFFSLRKFYD